MSEVLMIHKSCKIVINNRRLRVTSTCADLATFERVRNAYIQKFGREIVFPNREKLEVVVQCKTEKDYLYVISVLNAAKQVLLMIEPEKMDVA